MAFENPIILNNSGDNSYAMMARDWSTNPVTVKYMKIILSDASQLVQQFEIKSRTAFGKDYNRSLSLTDYTDSLAKQNLILTIPFDPPLVMDGDTYFIMKVPAFSRTQLMFFYEQKVIK